MSLRCRITGFAADQNFSELNFIAPAYRDGAPNRCKMPVAGLGEERDDVLDRRSPVATSAIRIRTPIAHSRRSPRILPMPRRLGLYGPFIALAIAAGIGSVGWPPPMAEGRDRCEAWTALPPRPPHRAGAFTWGSHGSAAFSVPAWMSISRGSPGDRSGWSVFAPSLKTEASVYAPGHWVAVAPDGATITRPTGGTVKVVAKVLRASLFDVARHPASFFPRGDRPCRLPRSLARRRFC